MIFSCSKYSPPIHHDIHSPLQVLVLANGAYGKRLATICETLALPHDVISTDERQPVTKAAISQYMDREKRKMEDYW